MKTSQIIQMLCIALFSTAVYADKEFDIEAYLKSVNVPKGMEPERIQNGSHQSNGTAGHARVAHITSDIDFTTSATGNPVFIAASEQAYYEGLTRTDWHNLRGPYVVAPSTGMGYHTQYGGNHHMGGYHQGHQPYSGCGSPNYYRGYPQLIYRYNPQPSRCH